MRITAKKGKGNKIHILADEEYIFTVSTDYWYSLGLAQDTQMTQTELAELTQLAREHQALEKTFTLLSYRDHSQKELTQKLARHLDAQTAADAVEHAAQLGYVDDVRYAQRMAEDMLQRKGFAPRRVEQELRRHGVDAETAHNVLEEFPFDPQEQLWDLLESRFAHKLRSEKDRKRTFDTLVRFGYAYADIRSVLCDYLEQTEAETEDGLPEDSESL